MHPVIFFLLNLKIFSSYPIARHISSDMRAVAVFVYDKTKVFGGHDKRDALNIGLKKSRGNSNVLGLCYEVCLFKYWPRHGVSQLRIFCDFPRFLRVNTWIVSL